MHLPSYRPWDEVRHGVELSFLALKRSHAASGAGVLHSAPPFYLPGIMLMVWFLSRLASC